LGEILFKRVAAAKTHPDPVQIGVPDSLGGLGGAGEGAGEGAGVEPFWCRVRPNIRTKTRAMKRRIERVMMTAFCQSQLLSLAQREPSARTGSAPLLNRGVCSLGVGVDGIAFKKFDELDAQMTDVVSR
jgi:hypothetical protein